MNFPFFLYVLHKSSLKHHWILPTKYNYVFKNVQRECNSSGVSHSDGSCVLGRIHSDVSSNIPKKMYHIVTDNFVNLLHISYAWLYKTECWRRKFHAFSFNSHRNCKIFMTNFNFIIDTICVPYIFRKSIFGWNCDHDTPLCDTPLLEDTPLCDTPDELYRNNARVILLRILSNFYIQIGCCVHQAQKYQVLDQRSFSQNQFNFLLTC